MCLDNDDTWYELSIQHWESKDHAYINSIQFHGIAVSAGFCSSKIEEHGSKVLKKS